MITGARAVKLLCCSILLIGVGAYMATWFRPAPPHGFVSIRAGQILPFDKCDFSKGNWKATLTIDPADFSEMDSRVSRWRQLVCTDPATLEEMKKTWRFKETGGDMSTVTSGFLLEHDGKPVFSSGIVLARDGGGFQSPEFGWAKVEDRESFHKCLGKFRYSLFGMPLYF